MIHFANTHDPITSWTFLGLGEKECQLIGQHFEQLAVTMFRSVGYLGRPDLKRRPGDASGLQTRYVPTPDSQLLGRQQLEGGICLDEQFNPAEIQQRVQALAIGDLSYQKQTLNRFTTPLQYFPINANQTALEHQPSLQLNTRDLVISSVTATSDQTGYLVRVYNPTSDSCEDPGVFEFAWLASVRLLTFNHETKETVATSVSHYQLTPFKAGEIRTYGIYPLNNDVAASKG